MVIEKKCEKKQCVRETGCAPDMIELAIDQILELYGWHDVLNEREMLLNPNLMTSDPRRFESQSIN